MNSQTKILLLIGAVVLLLFLLFYRPSTIPNQENFINNLEQNMEEINQPPSNYNEEISTEQNYNNESEIQESSRCEENNLPFSNGDINNSETELSNKCNGRNNQPTGQYKKSCYNGSNRGTYPTSQWNQFFDQNNNIMGNSMNDNNSQFAPTDETTKGEFASFKQNGPAKCGSNQDCDPEDLFNIDKYLPQEVNADWYDVMPEPISVKNRHLINISKPIGINTIGTSKKNASWDLRGTPAIPKTIVSPFLNSSIEPDNNIKPNLY